MLWAIDLAKTDGRTEWLSVSRGARRVNFREFLEGMADEPQLRRSWNERLSASASSAFRWETPALTNTTADRPFECVLVDSPSLARPQSGAAFREFLDARSSPEVATFPNLGGDARLVVPFEATTDPCYAHVAAFVRGAPTAQRDALWRAVAELALEEIGDEPRWLSTAGGGVPWLHVRLDSEPKYYAHAPYKARPR